MIELEGIRKCFGQFAAVDGISLKVADGEVLALLGTNGAGKTTTVRILAALVTPSAGTARVGGFDVVTQGREVRNLVGLLTENPGLYGRMSAWDYLQFFAELQGMPKRQFSERAESLLLRFGLWGEHNRPIGNYSKGMKQKVALIRAVIHEPQVLLLDEPTSAMDPASAKTVRDFIMELQNGNRTIIICTHNLAEAELLADRVAIIGHGKILAEGSTNDLKDRLIGDRCFEVRFANPMASLLNFFPGEMKVLGYGDDWLRFSTANPPIDNPRLLRSFMDAGFAVVSLSEMPRSLESVYLQTIQ